MNAELAAIEDMLEDEPEDAEAAAAAEAAAEAEAKEEAERLRREAEEKAAKAAAEKVREGRGWACCSTDVSRVCARARAGVSVGRCAPQCPRRRRKLRDLR